MAKVDFPDGASPFFNPAAYGNAALEARRTKEKVRSPSHRPTAFKSFLQEASADSELGPTPDLPVSEETVQVLLDDVHTAGEALKGRPFPGEIKRYKTAVRNFLHYVVENSYTVEERTSGINILKRKKFTLVHIIDHKLEQLAAGILAGQHSQLEILSRLEEISGLLVDLVR